MVRKHIANNVDVNAHFLMSHWIPQLPSTSWMKSQNPKLMQVLAQQM